MADTNEIFRAQLHSYALARMMMHLIGYDNFEPSDHAVHSMLIDDTRIVCREGNFRDQLEERTNSQRKLMADLSPTTATGDEKT